MAKSKKFVKRRRTFKRKGKGKAKVAPVKGEPSVRATYKSIPYSSKPMRWGTANGEVPQRTVIRMGYDDLAVAITPGAISTIHNFVLNSIFAPDLTGPSVQQPNFHDMMATLYKRYKVHGVKYSIGFKFSNSTTRTLMGITATDTLPTTTALDITRARAKQSVYINQAGTQGDNAVLSGYLSLKNLAPGYFGDIGYSANFGASPADLIYLGVNFNTEDATTNINGRMFVRLLFYVECSQPLTTRALD